MNLHKPRTGSASVPISLLLVGATLFAAARMPVALATPAPFERNAVITGGVEADEECGPKPGRRNPQVWLAVGQILLQQVEVPVGGNFEFHVTPGTYEVVATNAQGCLTQRQLTLTERQVGQAALKLEPARKPSAAPAAGKAGS